MNNATPASPQQARLSQRERKPDKVPNKSIDTDTDVDTEQRHANSITQSCSDSSQSNYKQPQQDLIRSEATAALPIPSVSDSLSSQHTRKRGRSRQSDRKKPIRARSAYNYFYQFQRKLLLKSIFSGDTIDEDEDHVGSEEKIESKYNALSLPGDVSTTYGYIPKKKNTIEIHTELRAQCNELFASESPTRKKRAHRKTPDKIEMQKLTKLVALRWKNADENVRSFFQIEADKDSHRYKAEMRRYTAKISSQPSSMPLKVLPVNDSPDESTVTNTHSTSSSSQTFTSSSSSVLSTLDILRKPSPSEYSSTTRDSVSISYDKQQDDSLHDQHNLPTNLAQSSEQEQDSPTHWPSAQVREATGSVYGYSVSPDVVISIVRSKPSWYKKDWHSKEGALGFIR